MYCSTYQVELSPALSAGESLSSPLSTDNKHAPAIMDLDEFLAWLSAGGCDVSGVELFAAGGGAGNSLRASRALRGG